MRSTAASMVARLLLSKVCGVRRQLSFTYCICPTSSIVQAGLTIIRTADPDLGRRGSGRMRPGARLQVHVGHNMDLPINP